MRYTPFVLAALSLLCGSRPAEAQVQDVSGPHQTNTALEFWRFLSDTIVERKADRAWTRRGRHAARAVDGGAVSAALDHAARELFGSTASSAVQSTELEGRVGVVVCAIVLR